VQAILQAEPGALDTLLADPRAFASARLGLDLPEGFAVRREGNRLFYGVGGDLAVVQLDELPDEAMAAVSGGSSSKSIWSGNEKWFDDYLSRT
jgi:hypothetical protein